MTLVEFLIWLVSLAVLMTAIWFVFQQFTLSDLTRKLIMGALIAIVVLAVIIILVRLTGVSTTGSYKLGASDFLAHSAYSIYGVPSLTRSCVA